MIALLTALAQAAVEYLKLRNATVHHDLAEALEKEIEQLEQEIAALRSAGDDGSQLRADRLRDRLIRRQGLYADLPAAGAPVESGAAGADAGRGVPTASR